MFRLFYEGGALFMSMLTLEFLITVVVAVMAFMSKDNIEIFNKRKSYVKSLGTLALVTGVLGQTIGLYSAFEGISQMGSVSQAMLAGGLRVSSITTIYGLIIFIISYLIWFGLENVKTK